MLKQDLIDGMESDQLLHSKLITANQQTAAELKASQLNATLIALQLLFHPIYKA
jgi:hypothetical protein